MFVSDWMTRKVITISPENSVSEAVKLMKEKKIKHVPVTRDERLKGIISDRDIREFSPSRATSLDIYELHYLLATTRVKSLMKAKVFTISQDSPIEEAAMIMFDNNIGSLPVVEDSKVVGIISDRDIFRVLVDITGVRHGGHRIAVTVEDRAGSVREVADIIRKYGFSLQSILTSYEKVSKGYRNVVIRCSGDGKFGALKAELMGTFRGVKVDKG
ncbi:MAG: CBS domain-containing protein [Nitrospirae bacterium]|nr:CBS domain-containing protein [Nitrospirota bacterium]